MNVFLMHGDRDVDLQGALAPNHEALVQDLELNTLFDAMAQGDPFLFDMAKRAVLSGLDDVEAIRYRQHVLADCLQEPTVVRRIYSIAFEAIQRERKEFFHLSKWSSPDTILHRSVSVLEAFVGLLKRLRGVADEHASAFRSEGFVRFFAMLQRELGAEYFEAVEGHLRELRFRGGVLISAELGRGNKGTRFVLRTPPAPGLLDRIPMRKRRSAYTFQLAPRDESGAKALAEIREQGIDLVANALAQSTDHILGFFTMLRAELGFYVGCVNLHERLAGKGEPTCFPVPVRPGTTALSCEGLYDAPLSLTLPTRAVGNDVTADGKTLVMITGANQGGKSTFLRSVGLAQLMMQSGMFVPAERFRSDVRVGVFTHYKREEDVTMESGKLDEELSRMSAIVEAIKPGSVLLCNESFASTNEREGSEIARQVVGALLEAGVKVLFVTHLFDLARGLSAQGMERALFLRAERRPDGTRTYRVVEGEPLPTSHGQDLYARIFATAPATATARAGRSG